MTMFLRGILAATSLVALLATTSAQIEHGMTCEEREATKPVDTLDLSKLGGVWYELALLKLKGYTDLNPQCSYTQFGPDSSVTTSFRQEKSATWQTMNAHVTTDGTGNMTITYDNIVPGSPEMSFNVVQAAYNDYLIIFGCWGNFFETFKEVHEVAWFLSRTPEPSPEAMAAFNDFREKSEIPWTSEFWTVVNQSSCETADVPTSLGPQQTTDSALQPGTEATAATAVTPQPGTEVTAATEAAPQPMTDKTAATEAAPQPMTDKTAATEATPQPMTDRTAATETLERAMDFLSQNNLLVILAAVFFVTSVSLLVLYHFYRPHPSQRAPSPRAHAASASTTCPEKKVAVLDMWPASSSVV